MAITPSYGWVTPSPTDFVTDLPADFETFADAVDADLAGLLGGTTGQILTKDSNTDHDFSWTTVSTGAFTTIASGSAAGGSISLTSIPTTYQNLVLVLRDIYPVSASVNLIVRSNGNATGYHGVFIKNEDTTASVSAGDTTDYFRDGMGIDDADKDNLYYLEFLDYANTSTMKICQYSFAAYNELGTARGSGMGMSSQLSTSAITSLSISYTSGNIAAGTYVLYGVK